MNAQKSNEGEAGPSSISNHVDKVRIMLPPPQRVSTGTDSLPRSGDDVHSVDRKKKEPKFVPYEPYRAAVVPIASGKSSLPKKVASDSKCKVEPKNLNKSRSFGGDNVATVMPLVSRTQSKENTELLQLRSELEATKRDNLELKDQLSQQTKINAELKKLLVASVGEDLETRLQFLAHDKVRLAHDVDRYVRKLLADHEELEKLSIQCDVWRSKFLASSLIVDGLANWKAVLYHRYDGSLDTLQHLLEEHDGIYQQLDKTAKNLTMIQHVHEMPTRHEPSDAKSVMDLAVLCNNLSSQLRKRSSNVDPATAHHRRTERLPTAGEKCAAHILKGPNLYDPPADYLDKINPQSCSLHSSIVHRFYPNTRFEHLTMNCCSQCSGEIQLL